MQREYLLGMQCLLLANLILFTKHNGNKEFVLAAQDYVQELQAEQGLLSQWEQMQRKVAFHLSKMKPLFERSSSTQANAVLVEKACPVRSWRCRMISARSSIWAHVCCRPRSLASCWRWKADRWYAAVICPQSEISGSARFLRVLTA